jgi:hypothetical protein
VEVSACIGIGPEVHRGTDEEIVGSLPDGEMTIHQFHGFTYLQSLTEVSDPRLEGTLYSAWSSDEYTLPGNEPEPGIFVFTDRIENDEGAWQGSGVLLDPDLTSRGAVMAIPSVSVYVGPIVMVGEGAYEGLTAIVGFVDWAGDDCTVSGYIIEGSIPAPPVPQTGQ